MPRHHISAHFEIDFGTTNPAWRSIRNSGVVNAFLQKLGAETVSGCNADLKAAQMKRRQPTEDGYDFGISHGSRSRLTIFPNTARAMAHEAVNQTILKNIHVGDPAGPVRPPDTSVPSELAQRSNAAQGRGTGGNTP